MSKTLDLKVTTVFEFLYKNFNIDYKQDDPQKIFILEGSSGSSKTTSIIQMLIIYCVQNKNKNKRIVISRAKYSWLKSSPMTDVINMLIQLGIYKEKCHKRSDPQSYSLFGNTIDFVGLDDPQRFHGPRQDITWINEAMEADQLSYDQLSMRTNETVILDFNPSYTTHWIFDTLLTELPLKPNTFYNKSTFRDNKFLPRGQRDKILGYEPTNENIRLGTADEFMWRVYGLGLRASQKGIIFKYVTWIDEFPDDLKYWYGLDLGFTCFDGDTDITTINGNEKIKDISIGTKVLTSNGYKNVLNVFNNGEKQVCKVNLGFDFGYKEVICTLDHNFKTKKGWKQLKDLRKGDQLYIKSPSTEKCINVIQTGNTQTITSQNTRRKGYTEKFGNFITVKYQKAISCITSTKIHLITKLITLLSSQVASTQKYTVALKGWTEGVFPTQRKIGQKEGKLLRKECRKKYLLANHAELNLLQPTLIKNTATENVIININTHLLNLMKHTCVLFAEVLSSAIGILNRKLALESAQINLHRLTSVKIVKCYCTEVYDLEVEDAHEYFANGILVHNCDPSTLVKVAIDGKDLYAKLCLYEPTDTPDLLSDAFVNAGVNQWDFIVADSSDKYNNYEYIKDLKRKGWNISPVEKTKGVKYWIDKLKEYNLHFVDNKTTLSKAFRTEQENYRWKTINDLPTNQPEDKHNHAFDALRYAIMKPKKRSVFWDSNFVK